MRCEDLLAVLADYVDGDLDSETTDAIRRHLEQCPTCELVVDNLRKTISVYGVDRAFEMPAQWERHLDGLLRARWKAKFSGGARPGADESSRR